MSSRSALVIHVIRALRSDTQRIARWKTVRHAFSGMTELVSPDGLSLPWGSELEHEGHQ
jgi:hypothetical protein